MSVRFVEETMRDGQLSLWATRMNTETMLGIARTINEAGFERACVASGAAFDTAIKFQYEDPWERLCLLRREMPNTPLEFLIRGRNLIGWRRYPNDIVRLLMQQIAATGFEWVLIFDGLNDMRNIAYHIQSAKEFGLKVSGVVIFTISPVHTDTYFIDKTAELVRMGADVVNFYDAAGLLTPERTRILIPKLLQTVAAGNVELELNFHASTGLALHCYREALRCGARILSTASLPLANSDSVPATRDSIGLAVEQGLGHQLDERRVAAIDAYFEWAAYKERRPHGKVVQFDAAVYDSYLAHQIPGGMMSNFVRQLTDARQIDRLPEIFEEVARVRAELGYPPMVTPYSQMIGVQATLNVLSGERYKSSPSELALYARGEYGALAAPIDPNVLDRICSGDKNPIDPAAIFEEPLLPLLRKDDSNCTDEELLMKAFYDPGSLKKLRSSQKLIDRDRIARTPLAALVKEFSERKEVRSFNASMKRQPDYGDVLGAARILDASSNAARLEMQVGDMAIEVVRESVV